MNGIISIQGEGDSTEAVVFPRGIRQANAGAATLSYSIKAVEPGRIFRTTPTGDNFEHFRYTFIYRYEGRSLQITWMCGLGYGTPKATDGLASAFLDAHSVEWETFDGWAENMGYDFEDEPETRRKAQRIYNACEKMDARLDAFFGGDAEIRKLWDTATEDR